MAGLWRYRLIESPALHARFLLQQLHFADEDTNTGVTLSFKDI